MLPLDNGELDLGIVHLHDQGPPALVIGNDLAPEQY